MPHLNWTEKLHDKHNTIRQANPAKTGHANKKNCQLRQFITITIFHALLLGLVRGCGGVLDWNFPGKINFLGRRLNRTEASSKSISEINFFYGVHLITWFKKAQANQEQFGIHLNTSTFLICCCFSIDNLPKVFSLLVYAVFSFAEPCTYFLLIATQSFLLIIAGIISTTINKNKITRLL